MLFTFRAISFFSGILLATLLAAQDDAVPTPNLESSVEPSAPDSTDVASMPTSNKPRVIIIETSPEADRSEVIRSVVEALEKSGTAKRATDDVVGKPVDFLAEISAEHDMPYEKITSLVDALRSLSIPRMRFSQHTAGQPSSVIIQCPANVTFRHVRTITETLEKQGEFKVDVRVAASDEPVMHVEVNPDAIPLAPASGPEQAARNLAAENVIVYRLKHAKASDVIAIAQHFRSLNTHFSRIRMVEDRRTNSVLVSGGSEVQSKEVEDLISVVDVPGEGEILSQFTNVVPQSAKPSDLNVKIAPDAKLTVFSLRYANAVETAITLVTLLPGDGFHPVAYQRTNSLFLKADDATTKRVEDLIQVLDVPTENGKKNDAAELSAPKADTDSAVPPIFTQPVPIDGIDISVPALGSTYDQYGATTNQTENNQVFSFYIGFDRTSTDELRAR